jgi:DNA polymerase-1
MSEKLFLIDAMAMIYRAYFAMISNPLITKSGHNVSAVYGFVNSLIKIIEDEKPDHIAVCFDTDKPTFRHKEYPKYKAQRDEIPTDMPMQIWKTKDVINAYNIPVLELDGYEADDIIGTLVKQAEKEGVYSFMVTPDKDYMQLVTEKTVMYKPARGSFRGATDVEIVDIKGVEKKFGVEPTKVIEVLGLMGDQSDNVPGVKGVGEVTAGKLIREYGSIENIYANIDKMKQSSMKDKLIQYKNDALLSKRLVTIKTDVPIHKNFHDLFIKQIDYKKLISLFEELEFKSFIKKYTPFITSGKLIPEKPKDDLDISILGEKIGGENLVVNIPETVKTLKRIKDVKHQYFTIKNNDEYLRLIKKLHEEELICFDTETTGLDTFNTKLVGMSFSYQEGMAFYIPVFGDIGNPTVDEDLFGSKTKEQKDAPVGVEVNFAIEKIKPLLENKKIKITGQNVKFDYLVMRSYGIEIENINFDTQIAGYILDPEGGDHKMDTLSEKYLNYTPIHIGELIGSGKEEITMDKVPIPLISEYAAEDADITLQLFHRLRYELQKINLYKLCDEIEFPLIKVLAEMQWEGIRIDQKILKNIDSELAVFIKDFEKQIYNAAEEEFNINSPKQLAHILFEKLQLKPTKKTKTGFSTDVRVLEELKNQHEIAPLLVEYRMLSKLKSTYTEGLAKSINPKTGNIHTSYIQIIAATGRLSSVNPNLQNIPIRSDAGRSIRKAFIPREKDNYILSADYSQIELRIMAHYSNDENMINAFKRDHDIHTETALKVFNVQSKKDVTKNMRRKAKEVNFGIIYGIGAFGLANRLEMRNSEAKAIIDRYFEKYPKVRDYMDKTKKFARDNGYVQTLMGRRRYLKQINNQNAAARAEDERAAINMPIQGTAADMIKIAMINIFEDFRKNKLKSKMLLQVHDELVFEVFKDELEEVKKIVTRNMKNAIKLNVPIEVDIGYGKNWFDAH